MQVVRGGDDRQASVRHGIAALSDQVAGILVHDGARPLVRTSDVRAGMRAVRPGTAALLATPVVDTIKVADDDGMVTRTLDRTTLWAAQTPQFATARDLRRAHTDALRHELPPATDDAALLERAGLDVVIVESSPDNFKVTLPGDLVRADAMLRARGEAGLADEEILLIECFVEPAAVDAVLLEFEARDARIDEIDRDLPSATVIRAYATAAALRGFGTRLARARRRERAVHHAPLAPRAAFCNGGPAPLMHEPQYRVGHGFDAHRLVEDRPFIVGGVRIPHETGPLGHSDADVLAHAISDALLGACALGDLGAHFPDTDPQWQGADSLRLLAACHELTVRHGWTIANIDATVVVQLPRLAPHLPMMRDALADALGLDVARISVKAKTSEGLGYTGDGSGIAAYAVVLVEAMSRPATT